MSMRSLLLRLAGASALGVAAAPGFAEPPPFYNPTNPASPTGYTIGYELFRTIGCPGRELFAIPCEVPVAAPVAAATTQAPEQAAPVAEPAPASAAADSSPASAAAAEPATAPVSSMQPESAAAPSAAAAAEAAQADGTTEQLAPAGSEPGVRQVLEGVNFDFDKAVIRPEGYATLDQDVEIIKGWGDVNIEVAGHTCNIGPASYNLDLSRRRAEAVRRYLIDKGVSADRLTVKGYGESAPAYSNATIEGRAQNRRVELVRQQ